MAHARTPGPYGTDDRKKCTDGLLARQELSVSGPIGLGDLTSQGVAANKLKALRPRLPLLPALQAGTRGSDVKKLQQLLNSRLRGAQLPLDGHFNQSTRDAVIVFQKAKGVSSDGVVGKTTWYQLIVSKRGSVQLPRNLTIAQLVGNANSTPAVPRKAGGPSEPVWEWPLHEKLLEVVKRVPSRLPDEARREWNAFATPEGIATALTTIAVSTLLSDGVALLLGTGWLTLDIGWNLFRAIETTARATSDDDLNAAADDVAQIVVSVGATLLLAGLFKYAGKLSATDAPEVEEADGPPGSERASAKALKVRRAQSVGSTVSKEQENGAGSIILKENIDKIEKHLARPEIDALGDPINQAMIARLRASNVSLQDLNFYNHELYESTLMDRGVSAREAHLRTLKWQGIKYEPGYESLLYHPSVIKAFPEYFNPAAYPK